MLTSENCDTSQDCSKSQYCYGKECRDAVRHGAACDNHLDCGKKLVRFKTEKVIKNNIG